MSNLNLITYKDPRGSGNFGDELSPTILNLLFKKYKINNINFSLNDNKKNNIIFIGSLIGWGNNNYDNLSILGSGIRTENDLIRKKINMKIYSVRGPLSKKYLENYGYEVNETYGDPALLLPNFYKPKKISLCKNKIGVVGHITNFHKYKNIPSRYISINPTWKWDKVIDYISSCELILSSSLHGLIMADAYNVPNIWLDEFPLNEGHFKFKDYFLSQDRKYEFIKNIYEYKKVIPNTKGNIIDLNKIEIAFKNMCLDLNLIE
jgi:pyruvyltransferase